MRLERELVGGVADDDDDERMIVHMHGPEVSWSGEVVRISRNAHPRHAPQSEQRTTASITRQSQDDTRRLGEYYHFLGPPDARRMLRIPS